MIVFRPYMVLAEQWSSLTTVVTHLLWYYAVSAFFTVISCVFPLVFVFRCHQLEICCY
ncbi:hypothetical protein ASPBRDRAFT_365568 [Aspergillus brasiliensis CBS 101740]|uniref:Uncharacterized protein n=1 Tax=Aspergillus brasiliensis (strain CBS 101740 / IMI 381727 / IBT 21946) TaxID=767769 RepID=A0A1L9U511_ASPBC|nr:hypothetical protein ASPBRDRAFT_365568 [Aspergillus brasiliensis CBS 101740]